MADPESESDKDLSNQDKRLLNATTYRNLKAAKKALKKGADINCCDFQEYTGLHLSAEKGFLDFVKFFVFANGIDLNRRTIFGSTALILAIDAKRNDIVITLLEAGADPNLCGMYDETPFHRAVFNHSRAIVQLLVEYGAEVNTTDCFNQSPLYVAMYGRPSPVISKLLLKTGANPNFKPSDETSILVDLVLRSKSDEHCKVMDLLIEYGANVNDKSRIKEDTPLHKAAQTGYVPAIRVLVQGGADLRARNVYHQTPVDVAKLNKNDAAVEYLIQLEDEYIQRELRSLTREDEP